MTDRLTIVHVENQQAEIDLLERVLVGQPADLHHVGSLADFFELAKEYEFDAVLLDLRLPDSDDVLSTAHRVASAFPDKAVIGLTTVEEENFAVAALRAGLCNILVKGTFSGAEVIDEIEKALARKAHQTETDSERSDEFKRDIIDSVVAAIGDRVQRPVVQIEDSLSSTKAWVETAKWVGGIIGGIFVAGWVSYGVVSQYATKEYVDKAVDVQQDRLQQSSDRISRLEKQAELTRTTLNEITSAQERASTHDEMLYHKDDYIERLLEWYVSGRQGPRPGKSDRLVDLEAKLVSTGKN